MLSTTFKTIFVHIPKTAGQSIEHVFLDAHGLTWETRAPLLLRPNKDPALGPERLAHLYARQYVDCGHVSADDFQSFYKFAVVRDPYARVMSQYRFQWADRCSFPEFIEKVQSDTSDRLRHIMASQQTFVSDQDGKIIVDDILRFEELPQAFSPVARRIFGRDVALPHVNKSTGPDVSHEFNAELRRIVYRRYERDFDLFRYPSGFAV